MAFVTLVVEHWLEWEIAQWVAYEGSIQWSIARELTHELHLASCDLMAIGCDLWLFLTLISHSELIIHSPFHALYIKYIMFQNWFVLLFEVLWRKWVEFCVMDRLCIFSEVKGFCVIDLQCIFSEVKGFCVIDLLCIFSEVKGFTVALIKPDAVQSGKVDEIIEQVNFC